MKRLIEIRKQTYSEFEIDATELNINGTNSVNAITKERNLEAASDTSAIHKLKNWSFLTVKALIRVLKQSKKCLKNGEWLF